MLRRTRRVLCWQWHSVIYCIIALRNPFCIVGNENVLYGALLCLVMSFMVHCYASWYTVTQMHSLFSGSLRRCVMDHCGCRRAVRTRGDLTLMILRYFGPVQHETPHTKQPKVSSTFSMHISRMQCVVMQTAACCWTNVFILLKAVDNYLP